MKNRKRKIIAYGMGMLCVLICAGLAFWFAWKGGYFLPDWISWQEKEVTFTRDEETVSITLHRRQVQVYAESQSRESAEGDARAVPQTSGENTQVSGENDAQAHLLWESPREYKVQDFLWCDINGDEQEELLLLCWKIGRFGKHKPFWVEEDEQDWSQHIFVYQWNGKEMQPLWMASDIGLSARRWKYDPHGILLIEDKDGELTGWKWPNWGLERVETEIEFLALGDNLVHAPIYNYGMEHGYDFLFENLADEIMQANVAIINQETILVEDPVRYGDFPDFGTPMEVGEAIVDAGFDVVSHATNHALDQGIYGIETTTQFYADKNIACLGIGVRGAQIVRRRGLKIAFLNYTYGLNGKTMPAEMPDAVSTLSDEDRVRWELQQAREAADILIVCVHWGTEYSSEIDEEQQKWTDIFFENRVDVVIGTHPHVLQPYGIIDREIVAADTAGIETIVADTAGVETIVADTAGVETVAADTAGAETMDMDTAASVNHQMLVYYSLGNYISAQDRVECIFGGMARFTIGYTMEGLEITGYELVPLITHQSDGYFTTYRLEDYSEELLSRHRLAEEIRSYQLPSAEELRLSR
ncbi:MAG: CapA family protein [Lachnospiraceae bacterium]